MLRSLKASFVISLALLSASCSGDDPSGPADAGATVADSGQSSDAAANDAANSGDSGVDAAVDSGAQLPIQTGLEIEITTGRVRGRPDGDLRIYKGIPFAEPPVGNLRFKPPVAIGPWDETLEAEDFGPNCSQADLGPEFLLGGFAAPTSEDCLTLNVWAHDDARARPVMVFIYGGGFVAGGASWPIYEAARFARRTDVVVVTFNYRLGVFGFLTTEELAAESGNDSAGNYAIHDQIEALRWIQKNIRAFGGDPDNVTIFGESAGAISVCALLGAPTADTLFHKAIIQSGMCTLAAERETGLLGARPIMTAGAEVTEKLGCADEADPVACLRALPVEDLVDVASLNSIFSGDLDAILATSPHVDGHLIPEQPLTRLARGEADRPLIAGSNENEGVLFAASDVVLTWRGLEDSIQTFTAVDESTASDIADLYAFPEFLTPNEAWLAYLGDMSFICPGIYAAEAASGGAPSFSYHFTRSPLIARALGAGHGMDLFYVFGTFDQVGLPITRADERVIETFQRAWGSFAYHGVPELDVTWPAYDPAAPTFAILDDPAALATELRSGRCDALKRLVPAP